MSTWLSTRSCGPCGSSSATSNTHEAEVLAGAERTLREDRPEILVEWSTPRRAYRERMFRLAQRLGYAIFQFEYGRLTPCATAERHSPPSWELGGNYVLLPCGKPAAVGVKHRRAASRVSQMTALTPARLVNLKKLRAQVRCWNRNNGHSAACHVEEFDAVTHFLKIGRAVALYDRTEIACAGLRRGCRP